MTDGCVALGRVLRELQGHWKFFPVQHMLLFLEVAKNDLQDQRLGVIEMSERLEMTQSSVSRGIRDMSGKNIPTGSNEPINLVTTRPDASNHRKRVPILTAKGRRVYQRLAELLDCNQYISV